ncbi:MAG: hypothetical protein KBG30_12265 [Bacteroidales bacterium]|nr:hypothetical protein [Bacteroidales bacterium]
MLGKRDENNDIIAKRARAAYMNGAITILGEQILVLAYELFEQQTNVECNKLKSVNKYIYCGNGLKLFFVYL